MHPIVIFFFFNDTATTEIYTLSLHDALPIYDVLAIGDAIESTDLPAVDALEGLVHSITGRLDHALRIVASPEGALPVVFTPAGLSAVLLPVTQGLSGKAVLQGISPLATRVGEPVFDQRLSLTDDPLP